MRPALRILSVLTLGSLLLSGAVVPRDEARHAWLGGGSIRLTNVSPGMLFTADGVGVVVPPPGFQVGAEAILRNGTTVTFSVETTNDGSVYLHRERTLQPVVMYQVDGGTDDAVPKGALPGQADDKGPPLPKKDDVPETIRKTVETVLERVGVQPRPQPPERRRSPSRKRSSSQTASEKQTRLPESETVDGIGIRSVLGACVDGAYQLAGPKSAEPFSWHFSSRNLPTNLSITGVEAALQRSVNRMVAGHNDCGLPDGISATANYAGRTTSVPNVSTSAACQSSDHKTELGFISLPTGMVGMACWWSSSGQIIEGDVAFNRGTKWYLRRPRPCQSRWSLEAAAAHELGHLFGLNHVSELPHGALTMAPKIMACQGAEITLGLGDVLGLQALY